MRALFVVSAALVAGAGSLVIELASVRALAPYFGASTEVWTGAIGVVLTALAAGYAIGGVVAERGQVFRSLGLALSAAGAFAALTPWILPIFAGWLTPENLSLGDAIWILRGGAFVTQATIFGFPIFLLGFANPLLVRAYPQSVTFPGRASGMILALSTLGGLLGTFGTTYYFIPQFGTRATLFGSGMAMGILGTAILIFERYKKRDIAAALITVVTAGFVSYPSMAGFIKNNDSNFRILAERDTVEQFLRVVEPKVTNPSKNTNREVWLQANECLDSFQSLDAPNRATPGHYYDILAAATLFSGVDENARICVIGAGAGSVSRTIKELHENPSVDAIELDRGVVDLGREYLRLGELENFTKVWAGLDGRTALRYLPQMQQMSAGASRPESRSPNLYDAILVDAYARQVEIPFHIVTKEMFQLCYSKLNDGGVVAINVSSFGAEDPVLRAIAATVSEVFASNLSILNVRGDHNCIIVARKRLPVPAPAKLLIRMRQRKNALATAIAQYLAHPSGTLPFTRKATDPILTDDLAPLEWLQAESLQKAREQRP
ncbi:MAG: fused MFS/spermidine synthase [Planctomycetota bacterium]